MRRHLSTLLVSFLLLAACTGPAAPQDYQYTIVGQQPHDVRMFTQGLLRHEGLFYESGGRYGQSRLIRYGDDGRKPHRSQALDDQYFAEGLTKFQGTLYLLTWRENTLLQFEPDELTPTGQIHYRGEGWGLTNDGEWLIRTDGSHYLHFHAPEDFALNHRVAVTEQGRPLGRLNELEYVNGYVWANLWKDDRIVQIDPDTGIVVGSLDLSELARETAPPDPESVLNGIAYDPDRNGLWVTGKNWPTLYLLELTPAL